MEEHWKEIERFQALVPLGDEAAMVLKAHLIVEESLWKFLAARLPAPLVSSFQDGNPVHGKALIQLAQAVAARDEVPITHGELVWPALYKLNTLRNNLAHQLEPTRAKVMGLMREVCRTVAGPDQSTDQLLRDFYYATVLIVGYLAIDRAPLTMGDIE